MRPIIITTGNISLPQFKVSLFLKKSLLPFFADHRKFLGPKIENHKLSVDISGQNCFPGGRIILKLITIKSNLLGGSPPG